MFQKWLLAFVADRGWRYLRQRQTRKQLQRVIQKRAQRSKQAKRAAKRAERRGGFKPGRALTLLALGAGAWAYFRSRKRDAWNASFSSPTSGTTDTNFSITPNQHALDQAFQTTGSTATETTAPTYTAQAADTAPSVSEHTTPVVTDETVSGVEGSLESQAPTYIAQSDQGTPEIDDTVAVPAPDQVETQPTEETTVPSDATNTVAVPAPHDAADDESAQDGTEQNEKTA